MGSALIIIIIVLAPLILVLIIQKLQRKQRYNPPPGPPGLPFIGNLRQHDTARPHLYLWRLSQRYGPLFSLKLGSLPTIVISSAEVAKEALKTHDLAFSNRPPFRSYLKLSYDGLDVGFSPYSSYWREMRKMSVVHLFSAKMVQSFRPIREDEVRRMISKISESQGRAQLTNLSEVMMSLTTSLICRIAFGKRYDEAGNERRRFEEFLHETQSMFTCFFASDYFPALGGLVDKLTGLDARLDRNFKESDDFYEKLIQEHLNPNRPKSMDGDILDVLIKLKEEESPSLDLTWNHIKAMLMDIFVAGSDTSAAATVWAMTALMQNPDVMRKVQAEIRGVVSSKKGELVNEEQVQKLPYLKAVVKESLRLFPPAPLLVPRETREDCDIAGYRIPAGTLVFVNAWAIARDPKYWKDPNEFVPERFLDSTVDFRGQDFEFIPFGAGRRGCPGLSMGTATTELALANLLHVFDWELPAAAGMKNTDIDTDVLPGITMHKKVPLCLEAKFHA